MIVHISFLMHTGRNIVHCIIVRAADAEEPIFVSFISKTRLLVAVEFVDGDGNIVVPKAVRPIIGIEETVLGSKKGARKQYRYGNLHIRDYDSHYTVHMDKVDPRKNPLGHLLADAPEYIVGAAAAVIVGRQVASAVYKRRKKDGRKDAAADAIIAGVLAGSSAGRLFHAAASAAKKVD